jgi:hypothetical protein
MVKNITWIVAAILLTLVPTSIIGLQYTEYMKHLGSWHGEIRDNAGNHLGFISIQLAPKEWKSHFQWKWPIYQFYPVLTEEAGHAFLSKEGIDAYAAHWEYLKTSPVRLFSPWIASDGRFGFDMGHRVFDFQLGLAGNLKASTGTGTFETNGWVRKPLPISVHLNR